MRKALNQIKNLFYAAPKTYPEAEIIQPLRLTIDLDWQEKKFVNRETSRLLRQKTVQSRTEIGQEDWTSLLPMMPNYGFDYAFSPKN